jgi:hypothetical protein
MMGDELVAFRRLRVGDEAARAPERRLRRATPGAANQLNRLCLDNIEQIVRALDTASARTMRAAARLLCAHVDANVSFDYAALGALDRACPTDEEVSGVLISSFVLSHFHVVSLLSLLSHLRAQVMRLVEVTAEDELAYVDIALINLGAEAAARMEIGEDYLGEDDVNLHIERAAHRQLCIRTSTDPNPRTYTSLSSSWGEDIHREHDCPCFICRIVRSTIREGYATCSASRASRGQLVQRRFAPRDVVRTFFWVFARGLVHAHGVGMDGVYVY